MLTNLEAEHKIMMALTKQEAQALCLLNLKRDKE